MYTMIYPKGNRKQVFDLVTPLVNTNIYIEALEGTILNCHGYDMDECCAQLSACCIATSRNVLLSRKKYPMKDCVY